MKRCLYSKCGKEFEPNKPKQKFCCAIHKVYWHREQNLSKEQKEVENNLLSGAADMGKMEMRLLVPKNEHISVKYVKAKPPTSNDKKDGQPPPMPTRNEGEDAFDFASRKNEWKRLYGK